MIFGFGKKNDQPEDDEDEEEIDYVLFQGALNGREANLGANARLAQAGLIPAKEIVTDALLRRADQLRIEPKGDRSLTQLSIDGVAYPGSRLSKQQGHAVTQMMKLLSGLDIQLRQKPQSGGIKAELQGTKYELRVTSAPVAQGAERLTVKIRNLDRAPKTAEEVGFSKELKERIRELTSEKKGIILVCGGPRIRRLDDHVCRAPERRRLPVHDLYHRRHPGLGAFPTSTRFEWNEGETLDSVLDRAHPGRGRRAFTSIRSAMRRRRASFSSGSPTPLLLRSSSLRTRSTALRSSPSSSETARRPKDCGPSSASGSSACCATSASWPTARTPRCWPRSAFRRKRKVSTGPPTPAGTAARYGGRDTRGTLRGLRRGRLFGPIGDV